MEVSKRREIQTAEASKDEWRTHHKPFGPEELLSNVVDDLA